MLAGMRRFALLIFAVSLLLAPSAEAEARETRKSCPRGAALADNSVARLYIVSNDSSHSLRACIKSSRKRLILARWFDCACSVGDEPRPQYWLR